jgi:uncharacterized cofD-like protein
VTGTSKRAVALGGGTGLPRVLSCLLDEGYDTTAIVTMADDGGSSGLLRREFGILPPGDARNCLVGLSDPDSLLSRLFQYRFPSGEGLAGHALGNLVIAALADICGDFPRALDAAGELLGAHGRVLPSTLQDVVLIAEVSEGRRIEGQAAAAASLVPLSRVLLQPAAPAAYEPALEALREADLVVVGPGSLYTSLLPNFLVAGITETMRDSHARRVYVCNVANQRGETGGMDAAAHVRALVDHGLSGVFDVAVVQDTDIHPAPPGTVEPVLCDRACRAAIESHGLAVVGADLIDPADPRHHDPGKLGAALREAV